MIAPALPRWVAATLGAPVTGVNDLLEDVPRHLTDNAPAPVGIYNAVDDAWVARAHFDDEATPDQWVLAIRIELELDMAGSPAELGTGDQCTVVAHLQGVTEDADNAKVLADAYRIMRAVRRSLLHEFNLIAKSGGTLTLEEQNFKMPDRVTLRTLAATAGTGTVELALSLPFTMTDMWAAMPISEI